MRPRLQFDPKLLASGLAFWKEKTTSQEPPRIVLFLLTKGPQPGLPTIKGKYKWEILKGENRKNIK